MKPNLILFPGFVSNSIILKGIIDYLSDYFNVYYIELPGFNKDTPPLDDISLDNFVKYAEKRIDELKIKQAWFAGISLGFYVANNVNRNKICQGMVGIIPYTNSKLLGHSKYLRPVLWLLPIIKRWPGYAHLSKFKFLWKSFRLAAVPDNSIKILQDTFDMATALKLGAELMNCKKEVRFKKIPHLLILSNNDKAIDSPGTKELFKRKVKELEIIEIGMPHIPILYSKKEMVVQFKKSDMKRMLKFVDR